MTTFHLQVDLGATGMLTPADVARALRGAADRVQFGRATGIIRDAEGANVGSFRLEGDWPSSLDRHGRTRHGRTRHPDQETP